MRQGQQNRRGRGRNNNQNNQQRKGQNPLTRSFESNGPDVKLRGTPAHIAEKYMSLARDAQSSGDPVLAENYLQHAEHYNRIIMAFREQNAGQGGEAGYNGGFNGQNRNDAFGADMDSDESFEGTGEQPIAPRFGSEQPRSDIGGERRFDDRPPRIHNEQRHQHQGPRDRDRNFQSDRGDRGFDRRDRQDRFDRDRPDRDRPDRDRPDRDRPDRDRPDRDRSDRPDRTEHRADRDRPERFERSQPPVGEVRPVEPRAEGGQPPRRRDRPVGDRLPAEAHEQPEFLRRPVRRPRREDQDEGAVPAPAPAPAVAASEDTD